MPVRLVEERVVRPGDLEVDHEIAEHRVQTCQAGYRLRPHVAVAEIAGAAAAV